MYLDLDARICGKGCVVHISTFSKRCKRGSQSVGGNHRYMICNSHLLSD